MLRQLADYLFVEKEINNKILPREGLPIRKG